jgi:hypothetical protein
LFCIRKQLIETSRGKTKGSYVVCHGLKKHYA